ncbi:hypothetical protein [Burkholderia pseudomallei]|uniref:hypothetical protein n=1 Tax=Burkholderia pseudomallei TaxID=28450 RepID=UPI000AF3F9CF|nr:hypothetical protein [Burkholderia pseudomallei]
MNDQQQSRAAALTEEQIRAFAEGACEYEIGRGVFRQNVATVGNVILAIRNALNLAASPEQSAQLTAQDALAAIETFEIVGENNDSREPNAEDRFILTEFVAHLFGGFRVELPAAAPADGACKRCGSTTAQACNDAGCFYLESGDGEPSAVPADERAVSFEAWCDRFPEISAVERLRDAWQEVRAAASPDHQEPRDDQ